MYNKDYYKQFDRVMLYLPRGAVDIVRRRGVSVSGLCNRLLAEWARSEGLMWPVSNVSHRGGVLAVPVGAVDLVPPVGADMARPVQVGQNPVPNTAAALDRAETPESTSAGGASVGGLSLDDFL